MGLPKLQGIKRVDHKRVKKTSRRQAKVWLDEQAVPCGGAGCKREVGVLGFVKINGEARDDGRRAVIFYGKFSKVLIPPPKLVNATFTAAACAARLDAIRPTAAARLIVALTASRKRVDSCLPSNMSVACRASVGSVLGCVVKWNLPGLIADKDATTPVCWFEFGAGLGDRVVTQ